MSELMPPIDPPLNGSSDSAAEQGGSEQAVQVQERLAAIGRLAAGITHDFNNSLAVIVLHAQIGLLQSDLSPTVSACLDTILRQALHAGELVQQVLDYARGTAPKQQPLRLGPFVAEQVRLLSRTLPENIALRFDEEAAPYTISANPAQIQQVLANLALNARDAMSEGGELRFTLDAVTVGAVTCAKASSPPDLPLDLPPGNWVRLRVADTGSGIPSPLLTHLFEPFFTTKAAAGVGLGLVQVQEIVRRHAGRIEVASELGRGTTFTLYFPAVPEAEAEPGLAAKPADALTPGQGETVLVVEDDAAVRMALVISLEQLGYRPLEARNGREALFRLLAGTEQISLVLSDITMPEMNGPALLEAMREHHLTTPLVFLSGHTLEDVPLPSAEHYAGSLSKPVQLDALADLLARVIALRP